MPIIPRNTPRIPGPPKSEVFYTVAEPNQTDVDVRIFQGRPENADALQNIQIGQFRTSRV